MIILKGKKASKIRILISLFKKYKKASKQRILLSEEYYIYIHMIKTLVVRNMVKDFKKIKDFKKYFRYKIKEGYELTING